MRQERLGGLDLLRGIAALCVALFHVHIFWPNVAAPFSKAYLAVDFFFMLSGFVLTRTYQRRFQEGLDTIGFMRLRLRRLWPTIAIGAMIGLVSAAHLYSPGELALFFALNLALLPFFAGGVVFPLNGVIWSIFFELVANAIHARVLWRLSRLTLGIVAAAMAAIMVFAVLKLESFGAGTWDVGSWQGNFVAGLPRVMLSYVIGSLLFLRFGDRCWTATPPWLAPLLLPAAMAVGWQLDEGWRFDMLFVLLVCPVVLMAGLSRLRRMAPLAKWSGDLSFPLYAVHVPVLVLASEAGMPWYAGLVLAVAVAMVTLRLTQPGWGRGRGAPPAPSRAAV